MDRIVQDIRYALRALARGPGFALTVVLLLATGIGSTTAVFSVVDSVLLRRLPYPEPERLVWIDNPSHPVSDFLDWQDGVSSISLWGGIWNETANLTSATGVPDRVGLAQFTPDFFALLDGRPILGRLPTDEEYVSDSGVVVLGYDLWQRRWGGDPDIVGQTIRLDASSATVIGVLGRDFESPEILAFQDSPEIWRPLDINAPSIQGRGRHVLNVIGRLAPNATIEAAQSEMDAMALSLAERFPDTHTVNGDIASRIDFPVVGLHEATVGNIRPALLMLLGAVAFLLLIACTNVGHLLAARGTDRAREFALRGALGARRKNLLVQLATESLILSLLGGAVGILFTYSGVRLFTLLEPGTIPRAATVSVDGRVLLFALVTAILTGLLFGVLPAIRAFRVDIGTVLKEGAASTTAGHHRGRTQGTLVVAEIALSLVLLAGAGLLFNSFLRLTHVETGFEPSGMMTVNLQMGIDGVDVSPDEAARRLVFVESLFDRLGQVPGTSAVVAGLTLPFQYPRGGSCCWRTRFTRLDDPELEAISFVHPVMRGFFGSMGIPLVAGRDLAMGDATADPIPMIVNESMARELFGMTDVIGRRAAFRGGNGVVVGVARDFRYWSFDRGAVAEVYVPFERFSAEFPGMLNIAIRTDVPADIVAPAIRETVWDLDPNIPVPGIQTMDERMSATVSGERFYSVLLGGFAVIALLLTGGGVYATFLYAVRQREREMGIRIALGAGGADIVRLILNRGLLLTAIGLVLGVVGAFATARLLEGMVFGITTHDPTTFAIASMVLGLTATFACLRPALRAARTNPVEVLRKE